ncbi:ImmA/IrrE family metallo-endopeptidase [Rugosimonospora africana]|uniref:ImmA/IrrE family metallo-endopeptidase n=1 Tax=Rugosimonospora africana TaxID=556532 RepID=UPI001EF213F0|nr:ImmA/IrrE family metallo-endopeptidase [Rugosimonospora africana]
MLTGEVQPERSLAVALRAGLLHTPDEVSRATKRAETILGDLRLLLSWFPQEDVRTQETLSRARRAVSGDNFAQRAGVRTAERLRDLLDLGDEPVADIVPIVESFGVPVVLESIPNSIQGLTVHDDAGAIRRSVVVVNTEDWWGRQRFTLAHELCHILFDDARPVIVERKEVDPEDYTELRCETFARHFLAPTEAVRHFWREHRPQRGHSYARFIAMLMMHFGISRQAALNTMQWDLKVPASDLDPYRRGRIDLLMRSSGLSEEWDEACRTQHDRSASEWLLAMALDAFQSSLIDASVVASVLGRDDDLSNVRQELVDKGWAPAPPRG